MITIEARKKTRKFATSAEQYNDKLDPITGDKTGEVVSVGGYSGERFPRSRQMIRPKYSLSRNRWMIDGLTQEEVNDLVKKIGLTYPDDHPKKGLFIETADLRNHNDPFFRHKDFKILLKDGSYTMDPDRPFDKLILAGLKSSEDLIAPGEKNAIKQVRAKYTIRDSSVDKEVRKAKRSKYKEAVLLLASMNYDKQLSVAYAMGLGVTATIDPIDVDELLSNQIDDDTTLVTDTETPLDIFLKIAKSSPEDLSLKSMIGKARKKGIIKGGRGKGYTMYGNPIGRTLAEVERYFDPDNDEQAFENLERALED